MLGLLDGKGAAPGVRLLKTTAPGVRRPSRSHRGHRRSSLTAIGYPAAAARSESPTRSTRSRNASRRILAEEQARAQGQPVHRDQKIDRSGAKGRLRRVTASSTESASPPLIAQAAATAGTSTAGSTALDVPVAVALSSRASSMRPCAREHKGPRTGRLSNRGFERSWQFRDWRSRGRVRVGSAGRRDAAAQSDCEDRREHHGAPGLARAPRLQRLRRATIGADRRTPLPFRTTHRAAQSRIGAVATSTTTLGPPTPHRSIGQTSARAIEYALRNDVTTIGSRTASMTRHAVSASSSCNEPVRSWR